MYYLTVFEGGKSMTEKKRCLSVVCVLEIPKLIENGLGIVRIAVVDLR